MAEWCYNRITFEGDKKNITELRKIIQDMIDRETPEFGVIPIIQEENDESYYFNINESELLIKEDDEDSIEISYNTKWSPNLKSIKFLCTKFGVEMNGYFSEESNKVYGECKFENGKFYVKELTDDEFNQCIVLVCDETDEVLKYRKDYPEEEEWNEITEQEGTYTDHVYEMLDDMIENKSWNIFEE